MQRTLALLDAITARDALKELRLMSDCCDPLTWSLYCTSRLANGHANTRRPSLALLQLQAAKQLLCELLAAPAGTKLSLADMAQQLLFQRREVNTLQVPEMFASARVVAKLWQNVSMMCPEVGAGLMVWYDMLLPLFLHVYQYSRYMASPSLCCACA